MEGHVNWTLLANEASAGCVFIAASLWLYSARVEVLGLMVRLARGMTIRSF